LAFVWHKLKINPINYVNIVTAVYRLDSSRCFAFCSLLI